MRRQLAGGFGADLFGENAIDSSPSFSAYLAAWTQGCTAVQIVSPSPSGSEKWSVLSVTIAANLQFVYVNNSPLYGKLGKVIAGLILNPSLSQGGAIQTVPMIPLPTDQALLGVMWDGNIDPMPPGRLAATNGGPALPISATVNPPLAIELPSSGEEIGVGIWITPSLYGTPAIFSSPAQAGLRVLNAQYVVDYDDGQ